MKRYPACPKCGSRILTGCKGTEYEHDYCDNGKCDWKQDRSEMANWYTWRTHAAHGGLWADSVDGVLAILVRDGVWMEVGSEREARDITDGAWLWIFEDDVPVLRRGERPWGLLK